MADKIVNLPNGKVSVNGTVMSAATYFSRYKMTPADKKSIASNPDKTSKPTAKKAVKAETKAAKQNTKILKKVDRANYSPAAEAARKKAAERAKAVPLQDRTPAQTRSIKTEARFKAGLPGYSKGPVTKEVKKADKAIQKNAAKASGGRGGMRGGALGGGGLINPKTR